MTYKIFIASSSKSRDWAADLQESLARIMPENFEFEVWDQDIFQPSSTAINDLINATFRSSAAIFVFSPDDNIIINSEQKTITRDNVIFEFGLFAGYLGIDRTIVLTHNDTSQYRLLSDINGLNTVRFSFKPHHDGNRLSALGPTANEIKRRLEKVLRNDNFLSIHTLRSVGLSDATFTTDRSVFSYVEAINASSTQFMLLGVGADKVTSNRQQFIDMVVRIMENGGVIRLLLLDPNSYTMIKSGNSGEDESNPFRQNVKNSLNRIAEIIDLLGCRKFIQIRSYFTISPDYVPPFRLTFIDDERCIVSPRSLTDKNQAKQQPQLIFQKSTTHDGPAYYGAFRRYFESLWRQSTKETVESMMQKIEAFPRQTALIGCVHGRFQPPHNGHQNYILMAKAKCDFLYIGITQPDIEYLSDCHADPHRAELANNPLTFEERAEALRRMLSANKLYEREHYLIIPFDIDRPDMLKRYISNTWVQYTTLIDKWNVIKNARLAELGYEVQSLTNRREDERISGTEIRRLARVGDGSYKEMVTSNVLEYLEQISFSDRLKKI